MQIKSTIITFDHVLRFERFFKRVKGCWIWNGHCDRDGYGTFKLADKTVFAHRLAWAIYAEFDPLLKQVLHHCDTPGCVNPEHLFLGDHNANMRDMQEKGRAAKGERQHKTTLTANQVIAIRSKYSRRDMTQEELAEHYSVCQATISNIVNRTFWGHV